MRALLHWFIGPPWPEIKESIPWRKFIMLAIGTYVSLLLVLMGMLVVLFGVSEITEPYAWAGVTTWPILAASGWFIAIGLVLGSKWLVWKVKQTSR